MIEETVETDRFVLRPLTVGDADEMTAVLADEALYEFDGGGPPTVESLRLRYEHQVGGSGSPDEVWLNWIIRAAGDERAIGFVQADVVAKTADLGWLVGAVDQGRGVAAESVSAVIGWLGSHRVRRIEAHIHRAHIASQQVARRAGLADTGVVDAGGELIWAADVSAPFGAADPTQ